MAKRPKFDPRDHGVDVSLPRFRELVFGLFEMDFKNEVIATVDELLLHPTSALLFVDHVRGILLSESLREHDILRALLNHRKTKKSKNQGA